MLLLFVIDCANYVVIAVVVVVVFVVVLDY